MVGAFLEIYQLTIILTVLVVINLKVVKKLLWWLLVDNNFKFCFMKVTSMSNINFIDIINNIWLLTNDHHAQFNKFIRLGFVEEIVLDESS